MYGFRSKLAWSSKAVKLTDNNERTLAFHVICPFSIHYEPVVFYSTGPKGLHYKTVKDVIIFIE
jgi:hypothetical protein